MPLRRHAVTRTNHAVPVRMGEGLDLPLDVVTEALAILARRGMGKTYTGSVLAEELIAAGLPVCVIDPVGVWWGLRSSADGTGPGFPVVIFGGEHADVPLHEAAGARLAEILAVERFPAILDLSELSKSAARRFVTDFLETLYRRNREPLHLIIDEADLFAPQRTFAGVERLLGAAEDAVRRGRQRGLGVTLISQRPAALHKTVLSQVSSLLVMGMTSQHDISAIDEWVGVHSTVEEARTVKASIPQLGPGQAWVWSPEWLGTLRQVQIRQRLTFDSSATPKAGQTRVQPREWATVNVAALTAQLATPTTPAAKGKANVVDLETPRLRARVAELEKQLAAQPSAPVISPEAVAGLRDTVDALLQLAAMIASEARAAAEDLAALLSVTPTVAAAPRSVPPARPTHAPARMEPAGLGGLGKAQRAILTVLAQHGPSTTAQVALLSRYSAKSGGYRNALSTLRTDGYMTGRGNEPLTITDAGRQALGVWAALPTGRALVEWWYEELGKAERAILEVLIQAWPAPVPTHTIADAAGYSASSGGFRNALSRLRTLGLASGRGELVACDKLGRG